MLPSRAVARALRSAGPRRPAPSRWMNPPSALSQPLGPGRRRLGTAACSPRARRAVPAQLVLPGAPSSSSSPRRAFSVWGYSWGGTSNSNSHNTTSANANAITTNASDPPPEGAAAAAPPPAEPPVPVSDVDLAALVLDARDVLGMPEQLGYLHAIGLDFGWGPTSLMQWTLEHVHVWAGLGWGASIVATALVLRVAMLYPQIRSLRFTARMNELRQDPRSREAMALMQQGFQQRDLETRSRGQFLNKMLREHYAVSNWGVAWSLLQLPFAFGLFRIVNNMAHVPVPSMATAGFLWFPDLTVADPYFLLPAVGTAFMLGSFVINSKYAPPAQRKMFKPIIIIFGTVGFLATSFLPAATTLMGTVVGASTLVTALILDVAVVRRFVGLRPQPAAAAAKAKAKASYEAPRPAGLRERLTSDLSDAKQGFSEQLSSYMGNYSPASQQEQADQKRRNMQRNLEVARKQQERDHFELKYKGGKN